MTIKVLSVLCNPLNINNDDFSWKYLVRTAQ